MLLYSICYNVRHVKHSIGTGSLWDNFKKYCINYLSLYNSHSGGTFFMVSVLLYGVTKNVGFHDCNYKSTASLKQPFQRSEQLYHCFFCKQNSCYQELI